MLTIKDNTATFKTALNPAAPFSSTGKTILPVNMRGSVTDEKGRVFQWQVVVSTKPLPTDAAVMAQAATEASK